MMLSKTSLKLSIANADNRKEMERAATSGGEMTPKRSA